MDFSDFKVYRWWIGGKWYFYKLGIDTPNICLFTAWLQVPPNRIDENFCTLLDTEDYCLKSGSYETPSMLGRQPVAEGKERKGGLNQPPNFPKPNIKPPAQHREI